MFIIFWGFRNKVRDHGATIAATCPRCHNSVVLNHVEARRWFTLFFIPLFPIGKGRSALTCPICRWGRDVPKEANALTNEMSEITRQWQDGGLNDEAYRQRVDAYWSFSDAGGLNAGGSDVPTK